MVYSSCNRGRFMKNFSVQTICNNTQEPQDQQTFNVPVGSSASLLC